MQLAEQLSAAGLQVFPCRADKAPAIPRHTSWRDAFNQYPQATHWPCGIVGVPIPAGVLVIDLDTYKGVTRQDVEALLGCALPWDDALIQRTLQGGEHYAFQAPWPCRNARELNGLRGVDLRAAGKGYIATGDGYQWWNLGVYRLAHPQGLPRLPEASRAVLGEQEHTAAAPSLPTGEHDVQAIQQALAHIDPGCTRMEWIDIGYALRHEFHDDPETGLALWHAWSAGQFHGESPDNYDPEVMQHQWESLAPERPGYRPRTIATLYQRAMQGGWQPPPHVNAAEAFAGQGQADTTDLHDDILALGANPRETAGLLQRIETAPCSPAERASLRAAMAQQLKDAGLLTRELKQLLDPSPQAPAKAPGAYGKNHTENAQLFLQNHYPEGTLVRRDSEWYAYNGKAFIGLTDEDIERQLAWAMADALPQYDHISSTRRAMALYVRQPARPVGEIPGNLVLFDNGVLDLNTGQLHPHSPELFTTTILPYAWNPQAQCPQWLAFLEQVFEGDQERIALLQEWMGYMMANDYSHHKVMLLLGPPRSGKGTIGRVLLSLVGENNYTGGSLHDLAEPKFVHSLRTRSVLFVGDAEQRVSPGKVDHVIEQVKRISGNDAVSVQRLYKDSLSVQLPTRITIASNSVPRLFDDSGALAGRLLVLPFDVSFYGREDLHLGHRLLGEMEGIAAWAVAGLQRLQSQGKFTSPQASLAEAQYIRETYSPVSQFLQEACTLGGETVTSSTDAYTAYRKWAMDQQEDRILARRVFISALKDVCRGRGPKYGLYRHPEHDKPVRGFKGLYVGEVATMQQEAFRPQVLPGGKA